MMRTWNSPKMCTYQETGHSNTGFARSHITSSSTLAMQPLKHKPQKRQFNICYSFYNIMIGNLVYFLYFLLGCFYEIFWALRMVCPFVFTFTEWSLLKSHIVFVRYICIFLQLLIHVIWSLQVEGDSRAAAPASSTSMSGEWKCYIFSSLSHFPPMFS